MADLEHSRPLLMWQFLRAFIWLDRGLQQNLEARGWPSVSRTESQVLLLVAVGIDRPIDISRNLGLTRQAINQTLNQLTGRGLLRLDDDPSDGRCKIVRFASEGEDMRADALTILSELEAELAGRGGPGVIRQMRRMDEWDWTPAPVSPDRRSQASRTRGCLPSNILP